MYVVIEKSADNLTASAWESAGQALNQYLSASSTGATAWLLKQKAPSHGFVPGGKKGHCKKCGAAKDAAEHHLGKGKSGPFIKPIGKLDAKNSKKKGSGGGEDKGKVYKSQDETGDEAEQSDDDEPTRLLYPIAKAASPKRFTLGPLYSPSVIDAHGDFIEADDLQSSTWDYIRKSDRTIRLQHNRDIAAGEVVEIVSWPFEVTQPLMLPDGVMKSQTLPPGTVFLGVIWEPWSWELIEKGKLRGYSMGGRAKRLEVDFG